MDDLPIKVEIKATGTVTNPPQEKGDAENVGLDRK